jgi:dolichol-phosphate mannosyltransferase
MNNAKNITIAIPLFNEEEVLHELIQRLNDIKTNLKNSKVNILLINDGSTDQTKKLISEICSSDNTYKAINFSRNFGHQAAVTAAIDHSDSDLLIIMDGDLQDPPELIPEMINKHLEGFEIVYTYRKSRKGSFFKRVCYFFFYRLLKNLTSTPINLDSGDFVLLSRTVILELRKLKEYHKFHRALRCWIGFSQTGIPLDRPDRHLGKSKYTLRKLILLAVDAIFSFSLIPLRLTYLIGLSSIFLGLIFIAMSLKAYLIDGNTPTGFTSIVSLIVFTFGVNMTFLGVIAEYVGRIYEQSKGRPDYIIDKS